MKILVQSILLILILITISCNLMNSDTKQDKPYSGITEIDYNGNIIQYDDSDWGKIYPNDMDSTLVYEVFPASPNPVHRGINLTCIEFYLPKTSDVKYIVLNQQQDTMLTGIFTNLIQGYRTFSLDLWNSGPFKKGIYRCFLNFDGLEIHGDIQIKELPEILSTEYMDYANIHWNYDKYRDKYNPSYPSHYSLPLEKNEAYYFLIGHADQFACGWDDWLSEDDIMTPNRTEYMELWQNCHGN